MVQLEIAFAFYIKVFPIINLEKIMNEEIIDYLHYHLKKHLH